MFKWSTSRISLILNMCTTDWHIYGDKWTFLMSVRSTIKNTITLLASIFRIRNQDRILIMSKIKFRPIPVDRKTHSRVPYGHSLEIRTER